MGSQGTFFPPFFHPFRSPGPRNICFNQRKENKRNQPRCPGSPREKFSERTRLLLQVVWLFEIDIEKAPKNATYLAKSNFVADYILTFLFLA